MADEDRPEEEEQVTEPEPETEEHEIVRAIRTKFPEAILAVEEEAVQIDRNEVYDVFSFLRDDADLAFNYLVDITAVDRLYLDEDIRFAVVYQLYSHQHQRRYRVKVPVPESESHVASITALWPSANWLEREVYDMYGITFDGHPNLQRLLMPDDYGSHPLRKDYPLHGKGERDNFVF